MPTYNPTCDRLKQKDFNFKASLDYIVRPPLKKKDVDEVT
jgi:hypothetical protein